MFKLANLKKIIAVSESSPSESMIRHMRRRPKIARTQRPRLQVTRPHPRNLCAAQRRLRRVQYLGHLRL